MEEIFPIGDACVCVCVAVGRSRQSSSSGCHYLNPVQRVHRHLENFRVEFCTSQLTTHYRDFDVSLQPTDLFLSACVCVCAHALAPFTGLCVSETAGGRFTLEM